MQKNKKSCNEDMSSSTFSRSFSSTSQDLESTTNAVSQVRVGVRVRPLTASESRQGGKIVVHTNSWNKSNQTVGIGSNSRRMFTFDSVFDTNVSQENLYQDISAPLLNAFLEGYNSTIMAYGQTGSGKTFTMGSESLQNGSPTNKENHGLIPRFLSDIFAAVSCHQSSKNTSESKLAGENTNFELSASFLEVYGEELHDLLDDERKSLPIREDSSGEVTVVGLKCFQIYNSNDALNILHEGTLQRTTAATLMNNTSSRSHAVFTIYLKKTESSEKSSTSNLISSSRLTFVDLAGSERMKRTGAEGERAREGIKINEGLLALGNVINALADDERLAKGEKIHVPYRQSKLTRLLQDALGGNSQTLFLACISPSDTNVSETLSTLKYANRARNIKNKPVKNIDPTVYELKKLHALTNVLQSELVREKFGTTQILKDPLSTQTNLDLFARNDVKKYIEELHRRAEENNEDILSLYKAPLSNASIASKKEVSNLNVSATNSHYAEEAMVVSTSKLLKKSPEIGIHQSDDIETEFLDVNPEQDIAILDQLFELQQHDQEYNQIQNEGKEELKKVDGELAEQENLLHQLRENLKQYHNMKEKYEILMAEVQSLEAEKAALAKELENAQVDPTKGCSKAIKTKLEKVESSLARARSETRKHQHMYKKAEQEAQKCRVLERKISDLKQAKVAFQKKQRENAVKHREYTEQKRKEIQALKKKERKTGLRITKLESECKKHKLNLEKRKNYCQKLSEKLKSTESHLMRVLDMRKKKINLTSTRKQEHNKNNISENEMLSSPEIMKSQSFASKNEEIDSIKFLLEKLIDDKVQNSYLSMKYEQKVAKYSELMRSLVVEVKTLNKVKEEKSSLSYLKSIQSHEENVEELELKIELLDGELEDLRLKLSQGDGNNALIQDKSEDAVMSMVANLNAPVARTILWEVLERLGNSMLQNKKMTESIERKDAALQSCEFEINTLHSKILSLSTDFDSRRSISRASSSTSLLKSKEFETMKNMEEELKLMREKLDQTSQECDRAKQSESLKRKELHQMEEKFLRTKDQLCLYEAAANMSKPSKEAELTLMNLQRIWKKVGISLQDRENVQMQIRECLENTCKIKLDDAKNISGDVEKKKDQLFQQITTIARSLGRDDDLNKIEAICKKEGTLMEIVEALKYRLNEIEPVYNAALNRRDKIVNDVTTIIKLIGQSVSDLNEDIQQLLNANPSTLKRKRSDAREKQIESREKRAKVVENVEIMMKELEPLSELFNAHSTSDELRKSLDKAPSNLHHREQNSFGTTESVFFSPPNLLSTPFLDKCEHHVKQLRLKKSEIMVANSQIRDIGSDLAAKMHLSQIEVLSMVIQSVKRESKQYPNWWIADVAEQVCNAITSQRVQVDASEIYGKHLLAVKDALQHISITREHFSTILKDLVEDAHKTLLNTVEGAIDASEASAIFNEALYRLPPLSKDYIHACIDEIDILAKTSEGMSQSELEALTVVWEASESTQHERAHFWSEIEESVKQLETKSSSPFDELLQNPSSDFEEWLLVSVQSAIKAYRQLNARLAKLSKIHNEVEKLRAKQDAKSKITSLDAEIRIISARLTEFEEKANNKGRLLTKKINSTTFLKEGRFRKQMQSKFASKLESLGLLLQEWKKSEGSNYNASTLSEDVQALLKNSDAANLLSWVEERTAFMHLKTVTSKKPKRRLTQSSKQRDEIESSSLPQPPRRGIATRSPSRKKVQHSEKFSGTNTNEKKMNGRDYSYRLGTPPRYDKRSFQKDSSHRLKTPPSYRKRRIQRDNSSSRSSPLSIAPHESKILKEETKRNVARTSISLAGKKEKLNSRGQESMLKSRSKYTTSPMRSNPISKRPHTPLRIKESKRSSILPFGDLLSQTPPSKENKLPR